uniref:Uncharacterized protein n=1 Tax=Oryza punctata TaxID=4537 RepID=A0A0E0JKS5_ORYPU
MGLAVEKLGAEEEEEAPDGEDDGEGHLAEATVHGQRIGHRRAAATPVEMVVVVIPAAVSSAASFSPLLAHACTYARLPPLAAVPKH